MANVTIRFRMAVLAGPGKKLGLDHHAFQDGSKGEGLSRIAATAPTSPRRPNNGRQSECVTGGALLL